MVKESKQYMYLLKGRGIIPRKSRSLIKALKNAGIEFPLHPKYDSIMGQMIFYSDQELGEETKGCALTLVKEKGVKDVSIEKIACFFNAKG